jgi:hypothetical protein
VVSLDPLTLTLFLPFTFRYLLEEGRAGQPKMMTVGLHCRLARPARAAAIAEFVDFAKSYGREVWICTREQIANHWYETQMPRGVGNPIKITPEVLPGGNTPSSRFSFLGNITTPREQIEEEAKAAAVVKSAVYEEDGDII